MLTETRIMNHHILSIDLLRMLLAFSVVFYHLHGPFENGILFFWSNNSTPMFMLISFWFIEPIITNKDTSRFLKRIQRLVVPMVFWAFVYGGVLDCPKNHRRKTNEWCF